MNNVVEKATLRVEIEVGADLYVAQGGDVRLTTTIYASDQDLESYAPNFLLGDIVEEMIDAYETEGDPVPLHIAANEFSRLADRLRSMANWVDGRLHLLEEDEDDLDPYESEEK